MWTMHTAIPDMRNVEWDKTPRYNDDKKTLSTKYLLHKHGLEYKPNGSDSMVVYTKGNFYHHKIVSDKKKSVYLINLSLVEEVVGANVKDIDGYVLELLAYGFFDKNVRKSLKYNNRKKRYFTPSEKTRVQDGVTMKQYHKVFADEA